MKHITCVMFWVEKWEQYMMVRFWLIARGFKIADMLGRIDWGFSVMVSPNFGNSHFLSHPDFKFTLINLDLT